MHSFQFFVADQFSERQIKRKELTKVTTKFDFFNNTFFPLTLMLETLKYNYVNTSKPIQLNLSSKLLFCFYYLNQIIIFLNKIITFSFSTDKT